MFTNINFMTPEEIKALFADVIEKPNFKKLANIDKQKLYNYRKRPPKLGSILEVLLQVEAIKVVKK